MTKPTLILDRMQFFGRLAGDYHAMFGVTLDALKGRRVLDCPAGPSSFVAEAVAAGVHAVGVDPLFVHNADELRRRCEEDIAYTLKAMAAHGGAYTDLDLAAYADNKHAALKIFLGDFQQDRSASRYINASLPRLPFKDESFDHTFTAHLLVTYSDPASGGILPDSPFTEQWHHDSVMELLRVTKRSMHLYPTTTRTSPARRHPYIESLVAKLQKQGGWNFRFEPSTYQRGDALQNQLNASLVIERQARTP
ncbi:MAG: hypothetical protein K8R92_09900 [Planctomycetes bacterium]|nr:hypothetical protein [Planctomycetota bacterium]